MFIKSVQTRIIDAYCIEPRKYEKKGTFLCDFTGVGKYVGYLLLVSYFILLPRIFEAILPFLIDSIPSTHIFKIDKLITGVGVFFINLFILLSYNISMIYIYRVKLPFFEKYRVIQVTLN